MATFFPENNPACAYNYAYNSRARNRNLAQKMLLFAESNDPGLQLARGFTTFDALAYRKPAHH